MRSLLRALGLVLVSAVLLGCLAAAAAVLARGWAAAVRCEPPTKCEGAAFDATEWKAFGNWTDPVRLRMVDDLTQRLGLVGRTRAWVDAELGTPERAERFAAACDYVYWLGPERNLAGAGFEWLCLRFDGDTVSEARIVRG